jgi:hypothetical protein
LALVMSSKKHVLPEIVPSFYCPFHSFGLNEDEIETRPLHGTIKRRNATTSSQIKKHVFSHIMNGK